MKYWEFYCHYNRNPIRYLFCTRCITKRAVSLKESHSWTRSTISRSHLCTTWCCDQWSALRSKRSKRISRMEKSKGPRTTRTVYGWKWATQKRHLHDHRSAPRNRRKNRRKETYFRNSKPSNSKILRPSIRDQSRCMVGTWSSHHRSLRRYFLWVF